MICHGRLGTVNRLLKLTVGAMALLAMMACGGSAVEPAQAPTPPPGMFSTLPTTEPPILGDQPSTFELNTSAPTFTPQPTLTPTPTYTPLPTPTPNPTATNYIWIPKYADPRMADKMINSYPATVVTLCRGIFGGAWSPNDPGYWETFDICAVNAQLGFPDPTGVATKGCVSSASGCKRYRLKE